MRGDRDFQVDRNRSVRGKGFGEILFHVGLCAGIGPDLRTRVGRIVTDGDELERDIRITGVDRVVVVIGIIPVS